MKRTISHCIGVLCWLLSACNLSNPVPPTPTAQATRTVIPTPTAEPTAANTPAPEPQLVDVGGRKMYIECAGSGSPVVILEANLGLYSGTWYQVYPEVAKFTRVCLFDRFGLGSSEPGPLPRTSASMVAELHELLTNAAVPAPYILVGHSFAGLNIRLFASTYPQEVSGLVFVDAVHPELDKRLEQLLPPEVKQERRETLGINAESMTFEDILNSEEQVLAAGPIPRVPVVVIRHGLPFVGPPGWPTEEVESLWEELQNDLATLGAGGKILLAEKSGHRIQEDQPEVVVGAIREVFDQVKK